MKGDPPMGGFLPSAALTALQAGMEMAQRDTAQAEEKSTAQAQIAQVRLAQQTEDRERRERLKRALATQRARFGAQGLSSSASSDAVLGGLTKEVEQEALDSATQANFRVDRINDQLAWSRRKSLLSPSSPQNRYAFSMIQQGLRSIPLLDQ
jgi:hypothetical protein